MAIASINHKSIGKKTHPPRTASAHLRYVLRASACDEVLATNMPMPEIGSRGGLAKQWLEEHEDTSRKNARVIDKLMIALPIELTQPQRVELLHAYVEDITGGEEISWLAALHDQDSHNPHVHMIFRDKGLRSGKRVVEFSEKGSTQRLRERWQQICNEHLAQAGFDARIDVRSLKVQREELLAKAEATDDQAERQRLLDEAEKLNRRPAGHEGPEPHAIEENGEVSTKLERLRKVRNEDSAWESFQSEAEFLRFPSADAIGDLIVDILDQPEPQPISEQDAPVNDWWDQTFATKESYAGFVALLSASLKTTDMPNLLAEADRLFADIDKHPDHPLAAELNHLAILGRNTFNGGWRVLPQLAGAVRDHTVGTGQEQIVESEPTHSTPTVNDPENMASEHDANILDEWHSENELAGQTLHDITAEADQPSEPPTPSQSAAEARRERQEAKAEEKVRRAAERARAKLERPITESRRRVLRGRTAINLAKGTLGNLSMGREALEPYSQSQLRRATDTFLSAAKWLTNVWDAYRTGDNRAPKFDREEKNYIEASETLAEMHLVVPKPKSMTGEDLLDERARLQKLEEFPDQGLVAPVMGTIKKRLKQVVAYLTTNDDGKAKAAQVERQRHHEFEQQLIEMRQREHAEQRRRSTINKVRGFLVRALDDPEIYDLVASYGFNEGQKVDEIVNDPLWDSVVPGSARVAWYDLERRIEALDAERQRQIDQATLKDLEETIGTLIDRANHETDPQLSKLIRPLNIHRFRETAYLLSDLRWLEPIPGDEQNRQRWELVQERISQLDAIEKRVREQRETLERQRNQNLPSPFGDDGGFSP